MTFLLSPPHLPPPHAPPLLLLQTSDGWRDKACGEVRPPNRFEGPLTHLHCRCCPVPIVITFVTVINIVIGCIVIVWILINIFIRCIVINIVILCFVINIFIRCVQSRIIIFVMYVCYHPNSHTFSHVNYNYCNAVVFIVVLNPVLKMVINSRSVSIFRGEETCSIDSSRQLLPPVYISSTTSIQSWSQIFHQTPSSRSDQIFWPQ